VIKAPIRAAKKAQSLIVLGWNVLRKPTTPVHWIFGVFCAVISWQFFFAGFALMVLFAGDELWNDKELLGRQKILEEHGLDSGPLYVPEGCTDWWESFLTYCLSFGVILILNFAHVLTIRWS